MKLKLLLLIFVLLVPIVYASTSSNMDVSLSIMSNNTAPTEPILISPLNNTNISYNYIILDWNASLDNENDTINYYVYGDMTNGTNLLTTTTSTSYIWTALDTIGTYYWKIIANDSELTNSSDLWQFNRISLSGSGGGGVSYPTYSSTIINIAPPDNITLTNIGMEITDIIVEINKPLSNVQFEIRDATTFTDTPTLMLGNVIKYYNINKYNINNDDIKLATIYFKVSQSYIQQFDLDSHSIKLNRYTDNNWIELGTEYLYEDDNYVYYKAKTTGFSYFAINGLPRTIVDKLRFEIQNLKSYYKQDEEAKFNILIYKDEILYDPQQIIINIKNSNNYILTSQEMEKVSTGIYEIKLNLTDYEIGIYNTIFVITDTDKIVTETRQFTITSYAPIMNTFVNEQGKINELGIIVGLILMVAIIITLIIAFINITKKR